MKTFGNVTIGVHGKELPKFADNLKTQQYWKFHSFENKNRSKTQEKYRCPKKIIRTTENSPNVFAFKINRVFNKKEKGKRA